MTIMPRSPALLTLHPTPEDDPATTPSVEFKVPTPAPKRKKTNPATRRRVHFAEDKNIVHENQTQCQEDLRELWYSPRELLAFRRDTKDQVLALRAAERLTSDPESWANSLLQVYQAFCAAGTPKELRQLIPTTPRFSLSTHTVGMEKRAIAAIASDVSARRYQLQALIRHWQMVTTYDDIVRAELMREASMVVSRPCRMYARNIALISAEAKL